MEKISNLQGLPNATNAVEKADKISLHSFKKSHHTFKLSQIGDGLCEGLDWLSSQLKKQIYMGELVVMHIIILGQSHFNRAGNEDPSNGSEVMPHCTFIS